MPLQISETLQVSRGYLSSCPSRSIEQALNMPADQIPCSPTLRAFVRPLRQLLIFLKQLFQPNEQFSFSSSQSLV
jgi:hypothetical protein